MSPEVGEYLVGAYLKEIVGCDFIDYNVRPPGGGVAGLAEMDVVGLKFDPAEAFLCEVSTHLEGLEYGRGYADSAERVRKKYERQRHYAAEYLTQFRKHTFMFWAPRVPKGRLTELLSRIEGLELVINEDYTERVEELRHAAKGSTRDTGNPVFRTLQLLEHLRKKRPSP